MMMNGYDTGMPAQQFSNMVQSPDAVNQFASAISQTSFSSVEAYNATNNILMDMNAHDHGHGSHSFFSSKFGIILNSTKSKLY